MRPLLAASVLGGKARAPSPIAGLRASSKRMPRRATGAREQFRAVALSGYRLFDRHHNGRFSVWLAHYKCRFPERRRHQLRAGRYEDDRDLLLFKYVFDRPYARAAVGEPDITQDQADGSELRQSNRFSRGLRHARHAKLKALRKPPWEQPEDDCRVEEANHDCRRADESDRRRRTVL
jgi:hypothetical protein